MAHCKSFQLSTGEHSFHDITSQVREYVRETGVRDGIAVVFTPHTTAAITINENADPDVLRDLSAGLDKTFPPLREYCHFEGNSDAHMKSSLMAPSLSLIISEGRPILGTWQDIYFCEFDGPRRRTFYVKVIEG
ncbi:secondary thiamine-phosphate synthase enzyme YjbQ [Bittarella sp. HCP28S3_D9]|uniref:secondary thiamine-phosphate synthase enzyme YjbQ n=1 Tax=Bittarella sp. HCP28S3_D9 TaxID=3440253 RepID=UPI003F88658E